MPKLHSFLLAGSLAVVAASAQASSIDFTQTLTDFDTEPVNGWVDAFRLSDDGVTFSFFNPQSRGTPEQFTSVAGPILGGLSASGLQIGGGGASAFSFDFSVSHAVALDGYTITNQLGSGVTLSIADGSSTLTSGNDVSTTGSFAFDGAPLDLEVGTTYSVSFADTGAAKQAVIEAFDFTKPADMAPIPVPAGLPLLLGGLAAFGLLRRARA
jgi:hypothetical protein